MSHDTAVQQWLMVATGYDDQHVIRSEQVGRRPSGDHAIYLELAGQEMDFAEVKKEETDPESDSVKMNYGSPAIIIYSVNIFAMDGRALLSKLWKSRYLLNPRLALRDEGMVLRAKGASNLVSTQGDTSWRRQFHADFTFGIFETETEEIEKLYTYRLEGVWKQQIGDDLDVVITD